jgi:hypothetical protein
MVWKIPVDASCAQGMIVFVSPFSVHPRKKSCRVELSSSLDLSVFSAHCEPAEEQQHAVNILDLTSCLWFNLVFSPY